MEPHYLIFHAQASKALEDIQCIPFCALHEGQVYPQPLPKKSEAKGGLCSLGWGCEYNKTPEQKRQPLIKLNCNYSHWNLGHEYHVHAKCYHEYGRKSKPPVFDCPNPKCFRPSLRGYSMVMARRWASASRTMAKPQS